ASSELLLGPLRPYRREVDAVVASTTPLPEGETGLAALPFALALRWAAGAASGARAAGGATELGPGALGCRTATAACGMTQAPTPPPSSLERAIELDTVRDVMLLETQEQMRAEPIPRRDGEPAPRGVLEARLRACRVHEDWEGERDAALELSRQHFELVLDIDLAVQLLHRALEILDDRELRAHLARQLATMGRHIEAGHVLRDGEPQTQEEVFVAWLASGAAYARAGDSDEAVATFREAAMVA